MSNPSNGQVDNVAGQTIAYYDAEAQVYEAKRYQTSRGRRADVFHRRVLDLMLGGPLACPATVLDLGCGTGRLLTHMAAKGHTVYGLDMSEGMLEIARQRLAGMPGARSIRLIEGTVTATPFQARTFDAVYSILVVNLIQEYPRLFQEVGRILKPGGVFVFNVPNLASLWWPVGLYVNLRGKSVTANAAGYRYSHWFLRREWSAALRSAGFEVEDVKGQPVYLRLTDGCAPLDASGLGSLLSVSLYIKARIGR